VAIDGIALYVNPQLSILGLTVSQVKDIFTGTVTNWSQVGGPNLEIKPFSRDPQDGGTPEYFEEKVMSEESLAESVQPYVRDTTDSLRQVASTPGGIGYATASEVCNQSLVRPLPLAKGETQTFVSPCQGKQVNLADFANDAYPITRRLFVVIKRDGSSDEQAGVAYVDMLLSDEGQQLVEQAGLVPLRTR
jgi:phosphate transport system substrate-binding protein